MSQHEAHQSDRAAAYRGLILGAIVLAIILYSIVRMTSARYAGEGATDEDNLAKFVDEVPSDSRLRYVCALAYVNPSTGEERVFFGDCRGRMARSRAGTNGFGYDPVFVPDGFDGRHRLPAWRMQRMWHDGRRQPRY